MSDPRLPPDGALVEDFADLFENAPCGYLSIEPSGRIFRANLTFCAWTGFQKEQLTGKKFQDLLHIAGRIYYETHFAPLLRMQGFFNEVALDLVVADGRRLPVLVNAVEKRSGDDSASFIRITVFDATDRRRYERELLQARAAAEEAGNALKQLNAELELRVAAALEERLEAEEKLRQAQKMEAIGQLTGGVAHDFNNLLTLIIGGLDMIGRQLSKLPENYDVAKVRRAREMALNGAQRAAALTARLLAFSRRQPLAPKALDINALIKGVDDLLQRTLGETISLESVGAAGLWRAMVDQSEFENVLINLAVNSRDAMPNGGKLTIETSNAALDENYVATLTEPVAPGQYVLIAVSDTGSGMDAATLARVFEPFFTTKDVGKGTGLGLSQVYGFLRQSGGHIRVYSEPGEGTTVKLYLPRAPANAVSEPARPEADLPTEGGLETILVVEDDQVLREFSTGVLRELGYRVLQAPSGKVALEVLDGSVNVDLLFTDVVLPEGMNGRDLADQAIVRKPGLKVLFTTGYTANAIVHQGRLDPGVNLITKPFTYEGLARKVRAMLG